MIRFHNHHTDAVTKRCVAILQANGLRRETQIGVGSFCVNKTYPGFYRIGWWDSPHGDPDPIVAAANRDRYAKIVNELRAVLPEFSEYGDGDVRAMWRVIHWHTTKSKVLERRGWKNAMLRPLLWRDAAVLEEAQRMAMNVGRLRCHLTKPIRDRTSPWRLSIFLLRDLDAAEKLDVVLRLNGSDGPLDSSDAILLHISNPGDRNAA